ncbi:MAG: M1 family metallopeptidase [Acidimicrobiales bacterium]
MTANPHRLPRDVEPSHYQLHLEPNLVTASFVGTERVTVIVHQPVDRIELNAIDLDITEAWLLPAEEHRDGDHEQELDRIELAISFDAELERAHLSAPGTMAAGRYHLHTRFAGELNDKLRGFYRSTFKDVDGQERTIATTQFESTNARRAFPCWDEPDFKATFGVTLTVDADLFAVSCGQETARATRPDGRVDVTFADTMAMSTYLVAFIVGPLEATDPVDVNGTPLRIVHPLGQGHLTPFALECGAFCVRYFEEYFAIPYPGDKLDLVAVPDFAFGAMENLGCVTFREVLLLIDPDRATQPELQRAADVIAHEIAHMWFGDLVTMAWWEGLWLKEAFATFMEMKATDAFRPDWQRWVDFGLSKTAAYDTDALTSTRAIEYEVISPTDAEGMYDILTYEKGAAVVRMLEQYLGEDAFRDGVRLYLSRHAYGNTRTTDLWDALEEATNHPVRAMMDSWIFQGGFPMVSVSLEGDTATLSQQHFRYAGTGPTTFQVPVIVDAVHGTRRQTHRLLLEATPASLQVPDAAVLVLNAGGHGFYRSRYEGTLAAGLLDAAQELLSPVERYALIDDAYAAMLAGQLSAPDVLAMCQGLANDDDLSVWQRIAGALGGLSRLLEGADLARFEALVRGLAQPALDIVGWEPAAGERDRQRELRATLFALAGTVGNSPDVAQRAALLDARALVAGTAGSAASAGSGAAAGVEPSLAAAAVSVLAHGGDRARWESFRDRAAAATTPQDQRRFIFALADFPSWELTEAALELCRSGEIKTQDGPFVVGRALSNRRVAEPTWTWMEQHWDELSELFATNTISRMVGSITTITDARLAGEVERFLDTHPVPQGAKTVAQNREKMGVMVALAQRESARLAAAVG